MARARKKTRSKATGNNPIISPVMIGIVVVAAVLIVAGLIFLGNQTRGTSGSVAVDLSSFPAKGNPDAPVTIIEYSDYG